jgi:DNA-binding SARP family transcriptional activator/predicted ATPase
MTAFFGGRMLHIQTVPDLRLHFGGAPVSGLVNTKSGAIAAYLALTGGTATRTHVAGLLWSDLPDEDALNNLRFTLSRLRSQLPGVIETTRREITLAPNLPRSTDLDVMDATDPVSVIDLRIEDFLANLHPPNAEGFKEWVAATREDLARRYLGRVAELACAYEDAGDADSAARAYRRCLALEPWSETFHRALARLHADRGDETGALAQLAACRDVLRCELGVEPEPETVALEAEIRKRRVHPAPPAVAAQAGAKPDAAEGTIDVGMVAERARLSELVLSPAARIITVLGPGGAGKTHLAGIVLPGLATRFPDGLCVARFDDVETVGAGHAAAGFLTRVAAALGVDPVPGRELWSVAEAVRDRRQVVLLDNFETIGDAAPMLGAISDRAPGLTFVVTSRHMLSLPTEWVVRLDGLAWPQAEHWEVAHAEAPAVALFLRSAAQIGLPLEPDRDGAAALRICAALEGWPLGLKLAASWLQVYGAAEIAKQLESDPKLLRAPAPGHVEPRHRSGPAVLDRSWRLLDDGERVAFAALSVFAGRFDAGAAEAVAGVGPAMLATLVGKSLLRREADGTLGIHPLIRDFGQARLAEDAARRDAVEAAHLARSAAMLAAARAAFAAAGDPAVFDDAARDVGDHLAAFRRLSAGADPAALDRFVADLWLLHRARGWIESGLMMLEEALAIPDPGAERMAQWRLWCSDALFQLGRIDACDEAARDVLRAVGEPAEGRTPRVEIPSGLARLLLDLPRNRPGGSRAELAARAWSRISQVCFFDGDRDAFVAAMLRAVTYRGGAPLSAALAGSALVLDYTPFKGSGARMARRAERALDDADPFDRAWTHELLALHLLGRGDLDRSRRHALDGAEIFRRLGQRRNWAECQAIAAYGLSFGGRIPEMREEMRALIRDGMRLGDAASEIWGTVGVLYGDLRLGDPVGNFDVDRARAVSAEVPDPNTLLLLHGNLAWLAAHEGRLSDARDERARFEAAFRSASMLSIYALHGFVGDFRALVILRGEAQETARALARLKGFARTFPAARPFLSEATRLASDERR